MIKTEPASLTLVHFARCIAGYALVISLTQLSGVHGDEAMTLEPGLKQLFLDDQAVEEMKGLRRRLHQPEKKGPTPAPEGLGVCFLCLLSRQARDASETRDRVGPFQPVEIRGLAADKSHAPAPRLRLPA